MIKAKSIYFAKISLAGMILLLAPYATGFCFKEETNPLTLRQKMTEISDLHAKVSQKIAAITKLRQDLNTSKQMFIAEIIQEVKGRQIADFDAAMDIPRVHFNLKLIEKLEGYTTALGQKIAYLNDANEQLVYYYQQIEDDLKIMETLKELDVENLLLDVNQALDTYRPETEKHSINANQIEFLDPQKLWRRIMAGML